MVIVCFLHHRIIQRNRKNPPRQIALYLPTPVHKRFKLIHTFLDKSNPALEEMERFDQMVRTSFAPLICTVVHIVGSRYPVGKPACW